MKPKSLPKISMNLVGESIVYLVFPWFLNHPLKKSPKFPKEQDGFISQQDKNTNKCYLHIALKSTFNQPKENFQRWFLETYPPSVSPFSSVYSFQYSFFFLNITDLQKLHLYNVNKVGHRQTPFIVSSKSRGQANLTPPKVFLYLLIYVYFLW